MTQSGGAVASARRTVSTSAPTGRGDEHDVGPGDGAGHVGRLRVDRAALERRGARRAASGSIPAHLCVCRRPRAASADRAADQPDADDRDLHAA